VAVNIEEQMKRDNALQDGFITSDGKFWFNEDYGLKFIAKVGAKVLLKEPTLKWKDVQRKVVEVPIEEAIKYTKEILDKIDEIYGV